MVKLIQQKTRTVIYTNQTFQRFHKSLPNSQEDFRKRRNENLLECKLCEFFSRLGENNLK